MSMHKSEQERTVNELQNGDRVELVQWPDDPRRFGTVIAGNDGKGRVRVRWDYWLKDQGAPWLSLRYVRRVES